MRGRRVTNRNLLAWFSEEERLLCPACEKRTAVVAEGSRASICFSCGAVCLDDGRRLDDGHGKLDVA